MSWGRGAWKKNLRKLGIREGDSLVYIVRDRRSGELLKVGETRNGFSRFESYFTRANDEFREIDIDIFHLGGPQGRAGTGLRKTVESNLRRGLSGRGHILPWDQSKEGWAPGAGPHVPTETPWGIL